MEFIIILTILILLSVYFLRKILYKSTHILKLELGKNYDYLKTINKKEEIKNYVSKKRRTFENEEKLKQILNHDFLDFTPSGIVKNGILHTNSMYPTEVDGHGQPVTIMIFYDLKFTIFMPGNKKFPSTWEITKNTHYLVSVSFIDNLKNEVPILHWNHLTPYGKENVKKFLKQVCQMQDLYLYGYHKKNSTLGIHFHCCKNGFLFNEKGIEETNNELY